MLLLTLAGLLATPGVALDLEDIGPVAESVDERHGAGGVGKDLAQWRMARSRREGESIEPSSLSIFWVVVKSTVWPASMAWWATFFRWKPCGNWTGCAMKPRAKPRGVSSFDARFLTKNSLDKSIGRR